MKVVITGAAGVLGTEIVRQLTRVKHIQLRLTDMGDLVSDGGQCFVKADLSSSAAARTVVDGAEVVIHCAAIHPWKQYTDDEYLDCNLKATYHLLKACVDCGVSRVIYTSSIAAVGYDRLPDELPLTEDAELKPDDLYGATKAMGERLCEMFSRKFGLHVICLRPPCFIPRTGDQFGVGLLATYGDVRDVAHAHVRALDRPDLRYAVFFCTAPTPYRREDAQALREDPRSVYCRYFPEARDFIMSRPETSQPLTVYYDLTRARAELSYNPRTDFRRWFAQRSELLRMQEADS